MSENTAKGTWFWLLLLLITVAGLVGFGLNNHGLFDVDEAIFAQATQEMLERQDITTPTYNAEPRYHKPPFTYWAQMLTSRWTDDPVLMARIPSAIFGFLSVLAMFLMTEKISRRPRFAVIAAGILGTSMLFIGVARGLAPADAALNFFIITITMGLLGNIYANKQSYITQLAVGLLCALGLLTKGPIAVAIPGAVVLLAVLLNERPWHALKCANPLLLGVVALVGLVPWAGSIIQVHGFDFFQEFLLVHNWERFTSDLGNSNGDVWWFYLPVLAIGFFPWFWLLPSAIMWVIPRAWRGLRSHDGAAALPVLGLLWLLVVVVVFSFSGTKLIHYVVPALPGAALLLAGRLDALSERPIQWLHLFYIIPVTVLLAGLVWAFPHLVALLGGAPVPAWLAAGVAESGVNLTVDDPQAMAILQQQIPPVAAAFNGMAAILLVLGIPAWLFLTWGRWFGLMLLTAISAAYVAFAAFALLPWVWQHTQQPLATIAEQIKQHYTEADQLFFVELHAPSVRLISGVPFQEIPRTDLVTLNLPKPGYRGRLMYVVEQQNVQRVLNQLYNYKPGYKCDGGYCLIVAQPR